MTEILAQNANLIVCLARDAVEVERAQRLRYQVFYEEMSAKPEKDQRQTRRDSDEFDPICDHLLVLDGEAAEDDQVVGTYRLLGSAKARRYFGFYSESEFELAPLLDRHHSLAFLELGRSCVAEPYRQKATIELLWQAIWTYVRAQKYDVMIGCASLSGADPAQHAHELSFLHHVAQPPQEWHAKARAERYVAMDILPSHEIDQKAALRQLPTLVKGYLRLGAYIGDGAVVDQQFDTVDVLIILPVSRINPRYFSRFGEPDQL